MGLMRFRKPFILFYVFLIVLIPLLMNVIMLPLSFVERFDTPNINDLINKELVSNDGAYEAVHFENFDNTLGADQYIVPNIVHFIHFNKTEINFVEYVVLRAVLRNQNPDKIYIHTNIPASEFTGKYWNLVRNFDNLWLRIEFTEIEAPTTIFNQTLSEKWRLQHGSDIGRLNVLMKYGGIYIDNDVYVVNSLDKYRKYEISICWEDDQFLQTQVIVAHKDARFLRLWLNSFRYYRSDLWYYNGGERPTIEILDHQPQLIHAVKKDFLASFETLINIYESPNFDWRNFATIHLLDNHRSYMDQYYNETPVFNEDTIRTYKYPFGEMAREVLENFS